MKKYIISVFLAVTVVMSSLPAFVSGSALDDALDRKESIDSKINTTASQKQQAEKLRKQLQGEEAWLADEQSKVNSQYNDIIKEIEDLDAEIARLDDAIIEAENDYRHHVELFKKRLRVMYMNSNESMLDLLFKSKDLSEFFEKVQFISSVSKLDRKLMAEVKACKEEIECKKGMREEFRKLRAAAASEKKQRFEELTVSRSDINDKIRNTKQRISDLESKLDELNRESAKLNDEIKKLQSNRKYIGGNMAWPCPSNYNIVSRFGMRRHPILHVMKMHTGIDIDADTGDPIIAANSGTVVISGWRSGYGNTVVVDHGGGITTLYAHCSKLLVSIGDTVKKEQVIARIGRTGLATGDHLHFEIRVNGVPVDPEKFGK